MHQSNAHRITPNTSKHIQIHPDTSKQVLAPVLRQPALYRALAKVDPPENAGGYSSPIRIDQDQ